MGLEQTAPHFIDVPGNSRKMPDLPFPQVDHDGWRPAPRAFAKPSFSPTGATDGYLARPGNLRLAPIEFEMLMRVRDIFDESKVSMLV